MSPRLRRAGTAHPPTAPGAPTKHTVVDYFAGIGGLTKGAEQAGATVVFAINHNEHALGAHAKAHPNVPHACEDATRFDPRRLPDHRYLIGGPACQGHSNGTGVSPDSPEHARWDESRATAWAMIDCAEIRRPRAILVENVMRFLKWKLFAPWLACLQALGYKTRINVCDTSLWGLPQKRDRVLVTAVYGREAPEILPPAGVTPRVARDVIDFEAGVWTPLRDKVEATRARAASGRKRFGQRFVMPYNGSGSGLTGRSLDEPIATITAADRWAVVRGAEMRMLSIEEYLEFQGFPRDHAVPRTREEATKAIGNAVPPVLAEAGMRALMEAS